MARGGKLSATKVDKTKGPAILHDGAGLYMRVSASGARSWVLRYQMDGRRRDMGLGPYPLLGLAEARAKAMEQRRLKLDGRDPLEERRAERQAKKLGAAKSMTFRQCAEAYIAAHQAAWRNAKHRQQWPSTLEAFVYPTFGDLPVQAIDVGLVMKALEPIWTEKPETASRVRGRIESVLDWPRRAVIARVRIRRGGAVISKTCCRRKARSPGSNTFRPYPMSGYQSS